MFNNHMSLPSIVAIVIFRTFRAVISDSQMNSFHMLLQICPEPEPLLTVLTLKAAIFRLDVTSLMFPQIRFCPEFGTVTAVFGLTIVKIISWRRPNAMQRMNDSLDVVGGNILCARAASLSDIMALLIRCYMWGHLAHAR